MASTPDPHIVSMLELLEEANIPPMHTLSVDGARELDYFSGGDPADAPDTSVRDLSIPGEREPISIRVYTPDGEQPLPVLVWFHAGGWVLGDLELSDSVCRHLATEAGCLVVSVDYRLAPEHEFPAAVVDCYEATQWVAANIDQCGGDADRLAVGGQSSGANLAAVVAQRARDQGEPSLEAQVLVSPVTNHAFDTDSYRENAEGYFLTRADMEWFWDLYLERSLDGRHPYASPLQARQLADLPPATIVTAGFDPLRDDGIRYAEELRDAGVDVSHEHYEGMIHGFFSMLSAPELDQAQDAVSTVATDLNERLALPSND